MSESTFPKDSRLICIDGHDLGLVERTGSFVLDERPEGKVTIIETGPSISVPFIKEALNNLNISLKEIENIIVTHIHLDHAGGAGILLEECPNATVIVHPKGKRHLHNPSRLIQGAKAIYKEKFDTLFEPVIPIPEDRLREMKDQETLQLSLGRTLTFYDTPGHAKHHFSIYDNVTETFFTGDTIGIRYPSIERQGISFYLPSTSPNQFNPDDMLHSLRRIENIQPKQIAFGHFGISKETEKIYSEIRKWIPIFIDNGVRVVNKGGKWEELRDILMDEIKKELSSYGLEKDDSVYDIIDLDVTISAMGVMDYLLKNKSD
ncbi:glyoxylase-like metal-dependent hydrolase (beta-lactamase superfamily II) [Evansella vedderi]|uniref:Glyoxylase-like metal-dependent hydrolase (Beta-lactamase superfamily II) n=1 Tax=Evansella vedderi TaxID=38282 RepID=A0ABT9ZWW8_9BACI|nr:MBL fold metallo-hydrolase [Evansella vedderi]MDQ0255236.1 glyoxylase-like metal-dependent hydrolase (beta-lactamase superfamily II) [Evansella vedderi]